MLHHRTNRLLIRSPSYLVPSTRKPKVKVSSVVPVTPLVRVIVPRSVQVRSIPSGGGGQTEKKKKAKCSVLSSQCAPRRAGTKHGKPGVKIGSIKQRLSKWRKFMANTLSTTKMTNPIRGLVSKRRIRYTQDGFDLDLTSSSLQNQ